jgi:hypothetical protein
MTRMHVTSLGCRSGNPTLPNVGIEWSSLEATVRSTDRDQRHKPIGASAAHHLDCDGLTVLDGVASVDVSCLTGRRAPRDQNIKA